jgi:hypothetical protein
MFVMGHSVQASRGQTSTLAAPAPSLRKAFADLWQALTAVRTGSYRPERHYMRGPGPKWHAKHAEAETLSAADVGYGGLTAA